MRHTLRNLLCFFLMIGCFSAQAVTLPPYDLNKIFNAKEANASFDTITAETQLPAALSTLEKATDKLEALRNEAKACVEKTEKEIKSINGVLHSTKQQLDQQLKDKDLRTEYSYLALKKKDYEKLNAQCHSFIFRSQTSITTYKDRIQNITAYKILRRRTPIWKAFSNATNGTIKAINYRAIFENTALATITLQAWLSVLILLMGAILIGRYLKRRLLTKLDAIPNKSTLYLAIHTIVNRYTTPILTLLSLSIFTNSYFFYEDTYPFIMNFVNSLVVFTLSLAATHFAILLSPSIPRFSTVDKKKSKHIFLSLAALFSLLLISYNLNIVFSKEQIRQSTFELASLIHDILINISVIWFVVIFLEVIIPENKKVLRMLSKILLTLLLLTLLILEPIGYHQLSVYIISGIFLTSVSVIAVFAILNFIEHIIDTINNKENPLGRYLHTILGIRQGKPIIELSIIKAALYVMLAFGFLYILMETWEVSENHIDEMFEYFFAGMPIGEHKLSLYKIIQALLVFSAVNLIGRLFAHNITKKNVSDHERDKQVAFASIFTYTSFAVAFLLALLVAGADFTGIAIIAGALSVGIGLGLQNIVNNFVSGVILLLEKPIRPGDRIIVGDKEGFVKKVRIRSTQVTTLAKEDIIIPNAELIANTVTNYMFRDKLYRISCKVGVAYGSDIKKVASTLLDIAKKHPDVIQDAPNEPMVLFREFGNSSLVFSLWCIIRDVNKKYHVQSDLNFLINEAFQESSITIAFPQRDLHIKDWRTIDVAPKPEPKKDIDKK